MKAYADTGFLVSFYLQETTSKAAQEAFAGQLEPLPLIPLAMLELRNTFNLAILRQRISEAERDAFWGRLLAHIAAGNFIETPLPTTELHAKARELSDRYTPMLGTRSLDLLHVAASVLLGAKVFFSFDERQRTAAAREGLRVKP